MNIEDILRPGFVPNPDLAIGSSLRVELLLNAMGDDDAEGDNPGQTDRQRKKLPGATTKDRVVAAILEQPEKLFSIDDFVAMGLSASTVSTVLSRMCSDKIIAHTGTYAPSNTTPLGKRKLYKLLRAQA